jgi:DNA-directed RNA polymerase specialized sigma24 family protein
MDNFGGLLKKEIPRLRRYARALTRDVSRTDDLVHNTLERAIAEEHFWQWGSNLRAWLFAIMHHQNTDVRRRRTDWPCRCAYIRSHSVRAAPARRESVDAPRR